MIADSDQSAAVLLKERLDAAERERDEAQGEIKRIRRDFVQLQERSAAVLLKERLNVAERQRDEAQDEIERIRRDFVQLQERVEAAGSLISQVGCDCPCDHDAESHDADCDRCFACRISDALWPEVSE